MIILEERSLRKTLILTLFCCFIGGAQAQIATQVGIGALYINGDVDHVFDPLNSFHLGIFKPISRNLNVELKLGFGKAVGLNGTFMLSAEKGGGLVEGSYEGVGNQVWYPNYLSTYAYADLGINYILNTGIERLRFIGGAGLGIANSSTNVNLLQNINDEAFPYDFELPIDTPTDQVKDILNRTYDATYETKFEESGQSLHLSLQLGAQFKIRRGIYFSLDARFHLSNSDYLDSIRNISAALESGNNDSVSILTLGFVGYLMADDHEEKRLKDQ